MEDDAGDESFASTSPEFLEELSLFRTEDFDEGSFYRSSGYQSAFSIYSQCPNILVMRLYLGLNAFIHNYSQVNTSSLP